MKSFPHRLWFVLAVLLVPGLLQAGTQAYVANTEGTSVFCVDADSPTASYSAFDIKSSSAGIAVRPQNDRMYVSDPDHDRLVIVDRGDGNRTTAFALAAGSRPTHLEMNRAGTLLYVANSGNRTVVELDISAAAPKVLSTMTMADNPGRLVLHPSGKRLFVLAEEKFGDYVAEFDLSVSPHERKNALDVSAGSTGLAVSPDGTRLFVVSPKSDRIITYALLAETGMVISKSFISENAVNGAVDVVFNPQSTRAYVLNDNGGGMQGEITTVDVSAEPAIVLPSGINVCFYPRDLAIDPSGTRLAVTSPHHRVVSTVRLTDNPIYDVSAMIAQIPGDVVFRQAPVPVKLHPADRSGGNPLETTVSATFIEDLDPATLSPATFVLQSEKGRISGTVSYSNRTVTFTPAQPLIYGETYTATLTGGVTNAAGIPMDQTSWKFYAGVWHSSVDSDSGCFILSAW